MAAPTTYHRFRLIFLSPWNIGSETEHYWGNTFAVSGTIVMNETDAEATALQLASPILKLAQSHTSLVEWAYYPSGTNVAMWSKTYTIGEHPGDGTAWVASGNNQQLEVCALARCYVKKNSRGKPVYLRKFIHDVQCGVTNQNAMGALTNAITLLAPWNTGSGPHDVVPVDPTSGEQGTGWSFETHLYTHQLRRGKHRKVAAAASDSTLSTIEKLIGIAAGAASGLTPPAAP